MSGEVIWGEKKVFFVFTQLKFRFCFVCWLIFSCESERGSGRSCVQAQ